MSKTVKLAQHLETLRINNMYKTDFYWTWDKTDDEIEAIFTVADALRDLRERNKSTKIFNSGLGISLYPTISGAWIDYQISLKAEDFLDRDPTEPSVTQPTPTDSFVTEGTLPEDIPQAPEIYTDLWYAMQAYNATIFREGQQHLSCEYAYEKPSFKLADYGLEDEIFGVISIPKLEMRSSV